MDHMKRTWLNGYTYNFRAGYDVVVADDKLDIQKYFIKKNGIV